MNSQNSMAQEVSLANQGAKTSDTIGKFLNLVQTGTKDEVDRFLQLLPLTRTAENERDSQNKLSKQLEDALAQSDVVEVWKLIAKINEIDSKLNETDSNLNETDSDKTRSNKTDKKKTNLKILENIIADRENNNEKIGETIRNSICYIFECNAEELEETKTEEGQRMRSEEERTWIEILSNPLYISLEWLWRNNPKSHYEKAVGRKESKFADIIEAALDDACLLEKIASYEHYYSRDEYKRRAEECETFAADIVGQGDTSDLTQLHEIMDIEGNGPLALREDTNPETEDSNQPRETMDIEGNDTMRKDPKTKTKRKTKTQNFNESLSLLKLAVDKQRKRFVASPNCQYALDEIVYRGWRNWKDRGTVRKAVWFLIQFALVAVTCIFYIPVRLVRRCRCCKFKDFCFWNLRKLYELPYSKFINHTMSYLLFLCLVFASSFQQKFGTTTTGLTWIDYPVLVFVVGLLLQEGSEASRQGFFNYISKWWNVVDTLIVFTFLLAYTVWLSAWGYYGEWKPRKSAFIVADTIYASATVMAFFHLAHIFQVNSVLGPLQLSLYKMLKDVLKFLAIFLLLYIAFATGVAKIYSYYVASQIKLGELNDSQGYKANHPYGRHTDTFIGMFWLLLGLVEEDKISVEDPAFSLTSTFGRIFMIAHVVCTVIVALNMLIAMMNNSYERIMENGIVEWKFSRTSMWLEWIDKGNTVPVPFNILYDFLYCLFCICCYSKGKNDPKQSDSQREGENQEGQNWISRHLPCCWSCCGSTFGCDCCSREKTSMRDQRKKEMTTLVVKYLKDRYSARWKELTAKTAEHQ